jgi:Bacterial protein of unknown function (DUF899)
LSNGPRSDRTCTARQRLDDGGSAPCGIHRSRSGSAGRVNRAYVFEDPDGGDHPALNVFIRRNGKIRHFWGSEMEPETADPGQDPRGAPDLMPLWNILDTTPEGRGTDWYPKLEYGR